MQTTAIDVKTMTNELHISGDRCNHRDQCGKLQHFLGNAVSMLTKQFGADLALIEQGISAEGRDKTFQRSRAVPS